MRWYQVNWWESREFATAMGAISMFLGGLCADITAVVACLCVMGGVWALGVVAPNTDRVRVMCQPGSKVSRSA